MQAEAETKVVSFTKMAQVLGAVMQFDPSVRADVNFDRAFRGVYDSTGARFAEVKLSEAPDPHEWTAEPSIVISE